MICQRDNNVIGGGVLMEKERFQGKVDYAEEATNLRHLLPTPRRSYRPNTMAPKSDPRNDETVNITLERIQKIL